MQSLLKVRECQGWLSQACGVQCLVKWWAEYPGPLLQERVVDPLQQYLTDELFATKKLTVSVMNVIKVLARVEEANQIGRKLPPEAFYNELIRYVKNCFIAIKDRGRSMEMRFLPMQQMQGEVQ